GEIRLSLGALGLETRELAELLALALIELEQAHFRLDQGRNLAVAEPTPPGAPVAVRIGPTHASLCVGLEGPQRLVVVRVHRRRAVVAPHPEAGEREPDA